MHVAGALVSDWIDIWRRENDRPPATTRATDRPHRQSLSLEPKNKLGNNYLETYYKGAPREAAEAAATDALVKGRWVRVGRATLAFFPVWWMGVSG